MQYCCNSTVATAGVLNVRAKRLRSNLPPRALPKSWKNCFSPAVPPQRAPPKSGKTVSHQPCPPKSGKNCFSPIFGMVGGWWCHMRSTNSALRADINF